MRLADFKLERHDRHERPVAWGRRPGHRPGERRRSAMPRGRVRIGAVDIGRAEAVGQNFVQSITNLYLTAPRTARSKASLICAGVILSISLVIPCFPQ